MPGERFPVQRNAVRVPAGEFHARWLVRRDRSRDGVGDGRGAERGGGAEVVRASAGAGADREDGEFGGGADEGDGGGGGVVGGVLRRRQARPRARWPEFLVPMSVLD